MSRIDFGVQIEPQYGFTYEAIRNIAGEAESLGFESLWVSDHFFMTEDSIGTPCLECWTTLASLARDTEELRLGSMVSAQSYRNPALLAKMAATVDNISGGRLNFGIGAGWKEVEYRAYGYPFPKPSVRVGQLSEAISIAKRMWTDDRATFKGRHYEVEDALCYPHPVQRPYIPIWVGGTGDHVLRIAARHADAVNFAWSLPPDFVRGRLEALQNHCKKISRNYREIRKSMGLMITMSATTEGLERKLEAQRRNRDTPYMRYLGVQQPNVVGTPQAVADRVKDYVAVGFDHFILRFHFGEEIESMRLFMGKVRDGIGRP